MKTRKGIKKQGSSAKSIFSRQIFSVTALLVFSIIFAVILSVMKNPIGSLKVTSLLVLLMSSAVSGIAIARRKGDGGVRCAIVSAVIFSLIILAVSLVTAGGKIGGIHFMNSLCYILVSGISALLFGHKKAKRRRR